MVLLERIHMIKDRGNQVIVRSQFNIHGSRGKSVKPFITDYVSRDSACDTSLAYASPTGFVEQGDGVAFTLDNTAISRAETLRIADVVEDYFMEGDRAIQQMVISFSPDYLKEQGIVDDDTVVLQKGDYRHQYDDVRLRHAVRAGVQSMVDLEGYRDPQMVAAIQHDTLHLHVHVVVYENYPELSRMKGKEERGVIKPSSFNQLTHDIDRHLTLTKGSTVPNERKLVPEKKASPKPLPALPQVDMTPWLRYIEIFKEMEEARKEAEEKSLEEEVVETQTLIDLDDFMNDFYEQSRRKQQQEDGKHKAVTMVDKQLDL